MFLFRIFREELRNRLLRRSLLRALLARSSPAAHRRPVQRNLHGKLLAVIRAAFSQQLIGKVLFLLSLHQLLQFGLIIVRFFRFGEQRQHVLLHDVLCRLKAAVQIGRSNQRLDHVRRDARTLAAAGLLLSVSQQQIVAQRQLLRDQCEILFADQLRTDAGEFPPFLIQKFS